MVDQMDYRPLKAASSLSPSASPTSTQASIYGSAGLSSPGLRSVHAFGKAPPAPETLFIPSDIMYNRADYPMYQPSMIQQPQQMFDCQHRNAPYVLNHGLPSSFFDQATSLPSSTHYPLQWTSSRSATQCQAISPPQAFLPSSSSSSMIPRSAYPEFHDPSHILKTQAPSINSQVRMSKSADNMLSTTRRNPAFQSVDHVSCATPATPVTSVASSSQDTVFPSNQLQAPSTTNNAAEAGRPLKHSFSLNDLPTVIKSVPYRCTEPGCKGRFKRQEHLKRHMKSHSRDRPYVCWVPGCHRAFSRSDNLNAHYGKTHSKSGGRNRYVATLDETSIYYNPEFRGQLTPDGRPVYGAEVEE